MNLLLIQNLVRPTLDSLHLDAYTQDFFKGIKEKDFEEVRNIFNLRQCEMHVLDGFMFHSFEFVCQRMIHCKLLFDFFFSWVIAETMSL